MRLKLKTTNTEFIARVSSLVDNRIKPLILKTVGPIEKRVRSLMVRRLSEHPILDELKNGRLALDFGLSPAVANAAISEMLVAIESSVSVSAIRGGRGFTGLKITVDPLGSITDIPSGSYDSNGHSIEWMDWLLTRGSQIVVGGFESVFALSSAEESRSGLGFMIKTGGDFRVDPQFAGTQDNNFLTEIVNGSRVLIENIIKEEINKVI